MTSSSSSAVSASWQDALTAATEMSEHTRRRARQQSGAVDDEDRWSGATRLLALALWRIAADQEVPVGRAVLDGQVFGYLRLHLPLLDPPLPAGADYPHPDGPVDPVLRLADHIMSTNHGEHLTGRGLGCSADGQPEPPFTVADRLDEITQDPTGLPELAEAEQLTSSWSIHDRELKLGRWVPSPQSGRLASDAHRALRIYPKQEPVDPLEMSWLARLRRLAHAAEALRTALTHHGADTSPYLTAMLNDILALLVVVTTPLIELELAWTQRPADQRLARWERQHMPLALRARVDATEHTLFMVKASLAACATGDVDP